MAENNCAEVNTANTSEKSCRSGYSSSYYLSIIIPSCQTIISMGPEGVLVSPVGIASRSDPEGRYGT